MLINPFKVFPQDIDSISCADKSFQSDKHKLLSAHMGVEWVFIYSVCMRNICLLRFSLLIWVIFVSSDRSSCTDDGLLLAPTGALIVMMVYYISGSGGNFFRF